MEFISTAASLPHIPDNVTIPQFLFDCQHESRPDRKDVPWLIQDETGREFRRDELVSRTHGLANGLSLQYGLGNNDVVLLFSRNHVDYPVAVWATHRLGGVISGANHDFTSNELLYQIQETRAAVIIVHPDCLPTALAAAHSCGLPPERVILFDVPGAISDDMHSKRETVGGLIELGLRSKANYTEPTLRAGEGKTKLAVLSFSSGTMGRPKAVAIPHFALIVNVIQIAAHNKVGQNYCAWEDQRYRPGDVAIGVAPLFHIYGLVMLHYVLFCEMSLVIIPKFNFVEMLNSIVRHRISHLLLVPPQVVLVCKHASVNNYDLRKYVRLIMCAAAPLSHELSHQLFKMFPTAHIGQGYGMTETCAAALWSISQKKGVPGGSGQLLPGTVARVVKSDGSLAGYDEPGELVIKTPSVALGYSANLQALTQETFVDGWVKTGDEVKIGRDGEVVVLDRVKEMMEVKGFRVAPAEIEGCLLGHPDVSNACVVGVPDDYAGEVPMAFVVLTPSAATTVASSTVAAEAIKASIIKHVADNKVNYKQLTGGVEFVSSIPTLPSGKLLRRILRGQAKEIK